MGEENWKKIYLFTGENDYTLMRELNRWKDAFMGKNGFESVISFNRENWDYGELKQTIFGGGLFVVNKLVILYGLPLDTEKSNSIKAEEIEKISEDIMSFQIPNGVLLVCVSYKPDKRGRFYKRISKLDKENSAQKIIKSFPSLSEVELLSFVKQEVNDLNLAPESIETLVHKVGNNQFRLSSEIEKLRYRKQYYNEDITPEIINDVCFGMIDEDVFQLLDLILTNQRSAVTFIQNLESNGLDWNALNGSLMRGLRNYLFVLDYEKCGNTSFKEIASELKQNPWAIGNIVKKLPLLKEKKRLIECLFKNIVDIDYKIKNGEAQPENYFIVMKEVLLSL